MNYLNKTPSQPSPSQGEEQTPSPEKGRDGVGQEHENNKAFIIN